MMSSLATNTEVILCGQEKGLQYSLSLRVAISEDVIGSVISDLLTETSLKLKVAQMVSFLTVDQI